MLVILYFQLIQKNKNNLLTRYIEYCMYCMHFTVYMIYNRHIQLHMHVIQNTIEQSIFHGEKSTVFSTWLFESCSIVYQPVQEFDDMLQSELGTMLELEFELSTFLCT
jgi:hypothetical protein